MKTLEVPQVPEWGEANKPRVAEFLPLLDGNFESSPSSPAIILRSPTLPVWLPSI